MAGEFINANNSLAIAATLCGSQIRFISSLRLCPSLDIDPLPVLPPMLTTPEPLVLEIMLVDLVEELPLKLMRDL